MNTLPDARRGTQPAPATPAPPADPAAPGPFAAFHHQRDVLRAFVESELISRVDFGPGFQTAQGKPGKPVLLKPGAEKIALWQGWRAVFRMDAATWGMAGGPAGCFCYLCRLVDVNGHVIAEGRGAADIAEKKGWSANNAIKIAAKRAMVDAVLRGAGLSEFFTQDVEDESQRRAAGAADAPHPPADARARATPTEAPTGVNPAAANPQRSAYIREVRAWYGVDEAHPDRLDRANAWIKGHCSEWQAAHPGEMIAWADLLADVVNARFDNRPAGQLTA